MFWNPEGKSTLPPVYCPSFTPVLSMTNMQEEVQSSSWSEEVEMKNPPLPRAQR